MVIETGNVIQRLQGLWAVDKNVSTDFDPCFKLQKIGWVARKAISLAGLSVRMKIYSETDTSNRPVEYIDSTLIVTGGFSGTTEKRSLDWNWQDHVDHVVGAVQVRSRVIGGAEDAQGKIRPNIEFQVTNQNAQIEKFLRGEIRPDGTECDGFLVEPESIDDSKDKGSWLHTSASHKKAGWSAEQVWGFEMINGTRYHTRRIVVVNEKGDYEFSWMVCSYLKDS